jgi:acyl-CoA synthetase (AMP-forming)/AMP-acid ligase II
MTRDYRSLVDVLRHRAGSTPSQRAFTFLADGERESEWLTYGELDERARALATTLIDQGIGRGDRAILLYPPGLEFVCAFFGALYAGVVAVPCYPPHTSQLARALPRLLAVIGDAEASVVLCPRPTPLRDGESPVSIHRRWRFCNTPPARPRRRVG